MGVKIDKVKEISVFCCKNDVKLVIVTKYREIEDIYTLYNMGFRDFGENKTSEIRRKYQQLPKDINWHMIGHLQSNKIDDIVDIVYCIHSIDSIKLLDKINNKSTKQVKCLLQVHIAKEHNKYGFDINEFDNTITTIREMELKNVKIDGLMGMATNTMDSNIVSEEFKKINNVKQKYGFNELSIGMSQDFELAVKNGSTILRIGSMLFE